MLLVINGTEQRILDVRAAKSLLASFKNKDDLDIWVYREDGSSLCALLNSCCSWLMFLRFSGDVGFSSRNRTADQSKVETEHFLLANGQEDIYPQSWTLERDIIFDAILEFVNSGKRPSIVEWHDDRTS